ncbi:MAG: hypothetical protein R2795_16395 [Saprospiraceae bacterium]
MSNGIEKSRQQIAKELQIAELEKKIAKVKTTIKSLKTRMQNNSERLEAYQKDTANGMLHFMEELLARTGKISEQLKKMSSDKRFSKEERELLKDLQNILKTDVEQFREAVPDMEEMAKAHGENREKASATDWLAPFRVEPEKEVKADIRALYLKLSKQLHPDMARNEEESGKFHEWQQQVVEAYKNNDLQSLLEIEQWHGLAELPADTPTVDALDATIKRLQIQLRGLAEQKERLSQEIKNLRDSEMGEMLTMFDSLTKDGHDMKHMPPEMALFLDKLKELEHVLREVEQTSDFSLLDIFIYEGLPSDEQNELSDFDFLEALAYADADFFGDFDDEDIFIPNPNPTFPEGSWVSFNFPEINKKGHFKKKKAPFTGRVVACWLDWQESPVYDILMDTRHFEGLPEGFISYFVSIANKFGVFSEVPEEDIQHHAAPSLKEINNEAKQYEKYWRKYAFRDCDFEEIILDALEKFFLLITKRTVGFHFSIPSTSSPANPTSLVTQKRRSKTVKVTLESIVGFDEEDGIIVQYTDA